MEKSNNLAQAVRGSFIPQAHRHLTPRPSLHLSEYQGGTIYQKHRRDGMSRMGTSRNVQWSEEGATK